MQFKFHTVLFTLGEKGPTKKTFTKSTHISFPPQISHQSSGPKKEGGRGGKTKAVPENVQVPTEYKAIHTLWIPLDTNDTLKSYLDARFGEPEPLTQLLAHERVRIMRLVK